ncbi:ribose transport system substrate-binding protein [Dethiosulfatibacter aminovorans DSM 17477]|uniref:Ribose transport system substrate-binding protein n=1 Tax=Dethiosulfatibacter aminovorans DSM 17477 TaxID=1121476 RepID=A0A1M6L317_9FIRM|nr:substrate-binding domain-containing protein [Dethiosulfatibacter aminovorans]SHJ65469.1 ribose transport system substrate-binding protein [Dethiosulfatibacter aminovorans DSM 17477]
MKKNKVSYFLGGSIGLLSLVLVLLLANIGFGNRNELIYFVSKTSSENSTFWHSVERGVKVAADELGVDLVFAGPERELDFDDQIRFVREGIEARPMAIILAASDYNVLADVSREVYDSGITFLTVDSDVNIEEEHSFVATDNVEAARILGEELAEFMEGEGTVGIISHLEGATSATDREEGFKQGISQYKNMKIVDEIPYSGNDTAIAYEKTKAFLEDYPEVTGLFGTNEATLIGIAKAIEDLGLNDRIMVVGFDISEEAASYLEKDIIKAIIVQRPFNMGYLSVKEAYRQAKGGKGSGFIDVDVVLVDKDNMFQEENQKFIIPFLE